MKFDKRMPYAAKVASEGAEKTLATLVLTSVSMLLAVAILSAIIF
jgi:hypothetical protein